MIKMRNALCSAVCALLPLTLSAGAGDLLAGSFGNTTTMTYADGSVVEFYFDEDGTFSTDTGIGGSWSLDGVTLCLSNEGESRCGEWGGPYSAGDTWQQNDPDGNLMTVTITDGR